jgi:hypothetical protein
MKQIRCRRKAVIGMLAGVLLSAGFVPALAHHAVSAKFDPEQPVSFSGSVTKVDWLNPHAHIFIDVVEGGEVANWAIELESPTLLELSGWSSEAVVVGDSVDVEGIAARDGSLQAWGEIVTVGPNRVLNLDEARMPMAAGDARPVPRWPDGRPRLGPPSGEAGYWGNPSSTVLVEEGSGVAVSPDGLLENIDDAGEVAPLQEWALGVYKLRQENNLSTDPMFLHCIPPGGPRAFQSPFGVQFVENRERERIFLLEGGANRNFRIIYLDGRAQVGDVEGDDDNPLFYGRSVATWEEDTLVIDTIGFNERFWFTNGGLPHTTDLHIIERVTRTDFDTLEYEVTIDDPGAYTRMWTSSWTLDWIGGEEMPVYYCQDNRP